MAPELFRSMEADELRQLATQIRDYQEAKKLSDSALVRKFADLGSTKTFNRILADDLAELDLERQLANYRSVWALIESMGTEAGKEEELYEDLTPIIELKRAFLSTMQKKGNARFILVEGDTGTGRLGAVWIPPKDIEDFADAIVPDVGTNTISHAPQVGTWFVEAGYEARSWVANTTDWGTGRYRALELVQDALNLKTPTVYDKDPRTDLPVINVPETEAARDKLEKIKERFKTWIWEDDSRRERLSAKYNTEFNSTRLRVFNGSHLTLPSSSQQIQLRPHQKDGIWRVVQSDNTLLAHCVGAGKTYTVIEGLTFVKLSATVADRVC